MLKIDNNLLTQIGLGSLPVDDKNKMLSHIYETLEMRVGMTLAKQMTNEQLDEFEGFIDSNNEDGALSWLETNFPNYKQVVADELDKLKEEIKAQAPQILASAGVSADDKAAEATTSPETAASPATPPAPAPNPEPAPQNPYSNANDNNLDGVADQPDQSQQV